MPTLLMLTACWTWRGYNSRVVYAEPGLSPSCARVGVQNLSAEQQAIVLGALEQVCLIEKSSTFANAIKGKTWLASCDGSAANPDTISGERVLAALTAFPFTFSIHPHVNQFSEVGKTWRRTDGIRVAINPRWIPLAKGQDPVKASWLRGNLAHEMAHVASDKFNDGGHGNDECPDSLLVSYATGKLVEKLWIQSYRP